MQPKEIQPGDVLPEQAYTVTRPDLVRYAGASGDRNPIHWSDRVATSVGLPGVIAHGMYTMALAASALDDWAGGPGRVREFGCKFTKPVEVDEEARTLNGFGYHEAVTGAPVLDIAVAYLDCEVRQEVTCGQHALFLGEVVDAAFQQDEATPLLRMEDTRMDYGG